MGTVLECDDYDGRIEFQGDYDAYQCGIKLTGVQPEDAGNWKCEMESYHAGYTRKYGYVVEKELVVDVEIKTPTMATTTSTTPQGIKIFFQNLHQNITR